MNKEISIYIYTRTLKKKHEMIYNIYIAINIKQFIDTMKKIYEVNISMHTIIKNEDIIYRYYGIRINDKIMSVAHKIYREN